MPQGSVLGPLLFLLYVNGIPAIIDCTAKMFADDTKIYRNVARQQGNLKTVVAGAGGMAVAPSGARRDRSSQFGPAQLANEQPRHRGIRAEAGESTVAPPELVETALSSPGLPSPC